MTRETNTVANRRHGRCQAGISRKQNRSRVPSAAAAAARRVTLCAPCDEGESYFLSQDHTREMLYVNVACEHVRVIGLCVPSTSSHVYNERANWTGHSCMDISSAEVRTLSPCSPCQVQCQGHSRGSVNTCRINGQVPPRVSLGPGGPPFHTQRSFSATISLSFFLLTLLGVSGSQAILTDS